MQKLNTRITLAIIVSILISTIAVSAITYSQVQSRFNEYSNLQIEKLKALQNSALIPLDFTIDISQITRDASTELNEQFESDIFRLIILAALISAAPALIVSWIVVGQLTKPIKQIEQGLIRIRKNDYRKIDGESDASEIQSLTNSYNSLVEDLAHVEELRDQLVSDISHEIKTPLTKLQAQIEAIRDGIYEPDEKRINKLHEHVLQLDFLISRFNYFSDIRANKIKIKKNNVNIHDLVDTIVDDFNSKNILIENCLDVDYTLKVDKNYFREILENIIENAYRYTEKGKITISSKKNKLIIADTGIGISQKDMELVFERLYRAEKSRNKDLGGMGLGLAIVKELIKAHGFKIDIKSKLGRGTRVVITTSKS